MFRIKPDPKFSADVQLTVPGQAEPAKVNMTFKYKTRDQLVEFGERIKDIPVEDAVAEIVEDWSGVDAKCTKENIKLLVGSYIPSGMEILTAYHRELHQSRVKN